MIRGSIANMYVFHFRASNRLKNGSKLTGMEIGELRIYNAYLLSAQIYLIAITMVGVVESTPPPLPRVSRVKATNHAAMKRVLIQNY